MKRTTVFLDQGEFMGGAEHWLLDVLQALTPTERRRVGPLVLGGECAAYQARLGAEIPRENFPLPAVKGGFLGKTAAVWNLAWAALRLKKLLRNQGATQIFTNTPRAHLTVLMLKRLWGWQGRWILMTHDFTTRPACLVRWLGASADTVIANALPTRQWLRQHLNEPDHKKIRLIENGIALAEPPQPATEVNKVLNLGRLDPRKGQQYLVEAADLLQERNPDLTFSVTGDSVPTDGATVAYETRIKQFAADRQLQNLSFQPGVADALATIDEYDALVFTPTQGETFGRVVVEALSRGKLVLAFAQTGPKEILQHYQRWLIKKEVKLPEKNLLLVEPNNAMSLAERLAYFADNPNLVELYTQHAAEFVAQNYSLAETKKRWLEVLGLGGLVSIIFFVAT